MTTEVDHIFQRYERRKSDAIVAKYPAFSPYQHFIRAERELYYGSFLTRHFGSLEGRTLLEIGAGTGENLLGMRRLGFRIEDIWANELLPERMEILHKKKLILDSHLIPGDATQVSLPGPFDVVFQSTVFSSILNRDFQRQLADRMWSCVKPGGLCLWYDFVYDNPWNPDVIGMPWKRVKELFPKCEDATFKRVTLAPPIGRRIGRLYPWVNLPVLRTHIVAVFQKQ